MTFFKELGTAALQLGTGGRSALQLGGALGGLHGQPVWTLLLL